VLFEVVLGFCAARRVERFRAFRLAVRDATSSGQQFLLLALRSLSRGSQVDDISHVAPREDPVWTQCNRQLRRDSGEGAFSVDDRQNHAIRMKYPGLIQDTLE
jgi:hypothetical protein